VDPRAGLDDCLHVAKKNAKQMQARRERGSKAVHSELGHQPSLLQLQETSVSQLKEIMCVTSCTLH
jgi:hypothetical protein